MGAASVVSGAGVCKMQTIEALNGWLISEGRLLGDEIQIVSTYCERLQRMGIPLSRVRIGQRYSNPLISAWGIIWAPEGTQTYTVDAGILDTQAWRGSPFEHVVTTRTSLRKRLMDMDLSDAHSVYVELAENGVTDFLAMPLEYGDGAVQGSSFSTTGHGGFTDAQVAMIEATRHALASALEPIAMRKSQASLLQTYLGDGPAREIGQGHIRRGEHKTVSAAILFADLRGFTAKSETWTEARLLEVMGDYFEMVVGPVQDAGGDVLKFMGDGVLAVFEDETGAAQACEAAISAASRAMANLQEYNAARRRDGGEEIAFVIGVDFGEVTFGNIGSPGRLDFTVVGPAVNVAARVQGLCKEKDETCLLTADVARHVSAQVEALGDHTIRGLDHEIGIFRLPFPDG